MKDVPIVAMVVSNYFAQSEVEGARKILEENGMRVDLISTEGFELQGMIGDTKRGDAFKADLLLSSADADSYDAVVLPGGVVNSDRLRMDSSAHKFLSEFDHDDRPIAAICHAPWVLVSAGLVEGRAVTAFPSLKDDLKNAGAVWMDKSVVVDGNLVTSRNSADIGDFSEAIVDLLSDDADSEEE